MPVVALLNGKGGVGKTTLSVHLATALCEGTLQGTARRVLAADRHKVLLVDADPQASSLDWSAQREAERAPALFPVVGLPKESLHREITPIALDYQWVVIDGPPHVNKITRSAVVAADLVIIPVQPSPFDVWAASEVEQIIDECGPGKPKLLTRFVVNRLVMGTTLGEEVSKLLAQRTFPVFRTMIRNRTEYAKAARTGLTALETEPHGPAAEEIRAWTAEIITLVRRNTDAAAAR